MAIVEIAENCFEIDGKARVDLGPPMRVSKATPVVLDDKVTPRHYQVGMKDALSQPIAEGQDFHWLDWRNRAAWVWKLYTPVEVEEVHLIDGVKTPVTVTRWMPTGDSETTKDKAIALARKIIKGAD